MIANAHILLNDISVCSNTSSLGIVVCRGQENSVVSEDNMLMPCANHEKNSELDICNTRSLPSAWHPVSDNTLSHKKGEDDSQM